MSCKFLAAKGEMGNFIASLQYVKEFTLTIKLTISGFFQVNTTSGSGCLCKNSSIMAWDGKSSFCNAFFLILSSAMISFLSSLKYEQLNYHPWYIY